MCLSDPPDTVCGRPLSLASARIRFSPGCKAVKSAWLAATQAQLQSVRTWRIDELLLQMYGPDRSDEYHRIVAPKVGNSLYLELSQLVKKRVLSAEITQNGPQVVWPGWTAAWTRPDWSGNRSEEVAKATEASNSRDAPSNRPTLSNSQGGQVENLRHPATQADRINLFEKLRHLGDTKNRIGRDLANIEHMSRELDASIKSEFGGEDAVVAGSTCSMLLGRMVNGSLYKKTLEMEKERDNIDLQMLQVLKEM
ncbi:hypothetical protein F5Y01DRAFT_319798 [Xylaria sp. FL0043]|nr:hypothetical protein F5Y01DRAFT_319798 [Xylaria sp. FL0043]